MDEKTFLQKFPLLINACIDVGDVKTLQSLIEDFLDLKYEDKMIPDDPKEIADLIANNVYQIHDDVIEATNLVEPGAAAFLAQRAGQFQKAERLFKNGYDAIKEDAEMLEDEDVYYYSRKLGFYAQYAGFPKDSKEYFTKAEKARNKIEKRDPTFFSKD